MEKVLVFFLLLWMPSTVVAKKLKRIEDRIARIETKHDIDSMTRREDISDLAQRLGDVEKLLNSSLIDLGVSGKPSEMTEGGAYPGVTVTEEERSLVSDMLKVKTSLTDDMVRVKFAFVDEKARWRRQASDMEHSIKAVQNGLSSDIQSLVKTVKTELVSEVSKMMQKIKEELSSDMQMSIKDVKQDVKDAMATLVTLQSIIQDMSTKCLASPVILEKLGSIDQMLVEHTSVYSSCLELYKSGERKSGAYSIVFAAYSAPIRVYCDMATDGGGWTVLQRRQDGSEDFFRGWDDYASGFGNVKSEFWLGNDYISQMTSQCCHEIRIDMEDFEGNSAYAKYGKFKVFPRGDDYKLDVGDYSGNASDSLEYHTGMSFTTKDKDNDQKSSYNCAQQYTGAWWYKSCHYSNLNGVYLDGGSSSKGIIWFNWKRYEALKRTEMKFRKLN